ncbi:hypothetical protein AVEN_209522-1 [Araneus ventricosus]|uniref:Uncharacterized protein n=1 Tax=Araneus ventricosus TaxID=182803 RepID=A0A4Y2INH8_ARAVE|nr:hypothetical protein AVEN_209522-1 [Araneus ventricosus]
MLKCDRSAECDGREEALSEEIGEDCAVRTINAEMRPTQNVTEGKLPSSEEIGEKHAVRTINAEMRPMQECDGREEALL